MDSLTQIVLGAAVGEAALGRKVGNKALFYGALAGTIPDLDVLLGYFMDTITAIEWHRGFSHSILFSVVFAPIFGLLVNRIERKLNLGWKPWAKLFFLGLFTHPLLDAFTTWGTQLFWPFNARIALNSIFVIDPLYTLPFLATTIILMFYKRHSVTRRRLNRIGLIMSTVYLFLTLVLKFAAEHRFEEALDQQGIDYLQLSTRPSPLNTILWNANIETENDYLIADYSFFDTKSIQFTRYSKNRDFSKQLENFKNVKRLINISDGWYIIENQNNNWYFNDLRFGLIPKKDGSSIFVFSYLLEEEQGVIKATEVPKTGRDAKFLMRTLWTRLQGN